MKAAGQGGHLKNIYNDYVYFWRWAIWQATELPPGPGVVAFITASSYLDGVSMGGLRHLLRETFDELWIIDLGGDGRGARKEDNIFDIQTPVAIAVGCRTGSRPPDGCTVRYKRVTGTRPDKLAHLRQLSFNDISEDGEIHGEELERFTPAATNTISIGHRSQTCSLGSTRVARSSGSGLLQRPATSWITAGRP